MSSSRRFLVWFFALTIALLLTGVLFNVAADYYILHHRQGASVQLVSGFERVLKPAWLDSIKPDTVFIGSSRIRMGFDPDLVDPEFHIRSFNYGVSSASAYETRRFIQDAAAAPSVKAIFVSLDAFTFGSAAQPYGSGFDDLRLTVTPQGSLTAHRTFRLFAARYLGGGALGMHVMGVWLLARLGAQNAWDRPDLFDAYRQMTQRDFRKDMQRRERRGMHLSDWNRGQMRSALAAVCNATIKVYWFFPPDNFAVTSRYITNDAAGLIAFKQAILNDVTAHNATCKSKVRLFDFMTLNAITADKSAMRGGKSVYYSDLVHFRPQTGMLLLHRMLDNHADHFANLGDDLTTDRNARADIGSIRDQAHAWSNQH